MINYSAISEHITDIIAGVVALSVLLFLSAIMSGSEVALFSLNAATKSKLKQSRKQNHQHIIKLLQQPEKLLATVLTANSFINIAFVIIFVWLSNIFFVFSNNPILIFIVQTLVATLLILLIGEVLPKTLATHNALRFAEFSVIFVVAAQFFLSPIITLLTKSMSVIKLKPKQLFKFNELSDAIDLAAKELNEEKKILKGIVNFASIRANEILIPRMDVKFVDIRYSFQQVIQTIRECGYSRMPVIRNNFDQVVGVLYIKDLLPHIHKTDFKWQSLIRPPYFVPESKFINELLEEFQEKKIHMAIVVDEYGGTSGILTLEDILEEIVGNIDDEFDTDAPTIKKIREFEYETDGKTLIYDFCSFAQIDEKIFEEIKADAETIAGLILQHTGNIPKTNDVITIANIQFIIKQADMRRIKTVHIILPKPPENEHY
ncbi:MAG: gliding motility-associated protein GldE [Bacteroidales bacterium]|nr:gliding motility-associated protein GldE [Bacteroidales bacterium]